MLQVKFPDELVFLDSIKENDLKKVTELLKKASKHIDINALNDAGKQRLNLKS